METVGSYEAKAHLPRLLEQVRRGSRFTITRHGVPVAMLVPVSGPSRSDIAEAIAQLKAFQQAHHLGGLSLRDLIEEGRRR
jgi:prevent-host-death family protein